MNEALFFGTRVEAGRLHAVFDPAYWRESSGFVPRDRLPDTWIDSPSRLIEMELRRSHALATCTKPPQSVEVDLFIWAYVHQSSPTNLTRIGGVPWREADKPWPIGPSGRPMVFLAQLCFADSHDVVGRKLPADVLLVFGDDEYGTGNFGSNLHLEWADLSLDNPLRSESQIPPRCTLPLSLAGVRYRTRQYPFEDADGLFGNKSIYDAIWQGTIIGRAAFVTDADHYNGLIGTLGPVSPMMQHWPFVNIERGPSFRAPKGHDVPILDWFEFGLGDATSVAIQMPSDGKVIAAI